MPPGIFEINIICCSRTRCKQIVIMLILGRFNYFKPFRSPFGRHLEYTEMLKDDKMSSGGFLIRIL